MDFGTLHLSRLPGGAAPLLWGDCTVNRVLVIVALVLGLLVLLDYFRLAPLLFGCLVRSRGNIEIEHSVSQARNRNRCALVALVLFCLIVDRFGLYPAAFVAELAPEFRVAAVAGVVVAFLLFRALLYGLVPRRRLDSEGRAAVRDALFNYFLIVMPLMLLTVAVAFVFNLSDSLIHWVLLVEVAAFLCLTLFREGQIFLTKYSGLQVFLYLCGLELIPLAALVVSAAVM